VCDGFFGGMSFGGVAIKVKIPAPVLTWACVGGWSGLSICCGTRKMQIRVFANEPTICENEFRNTLS